MLKILEPAAISDPEPTLSLVTVKVRNNTLRTLRFDTPLVHLFGLAGCDFIPGGGTISML